jgi:hypothetical protein
MPEGEFAEEKEVKGNRRGVWFKKGQGRRKAVGGATQETYPPDDVEDVETLSRGSDSRS